VNVSHVGLTSAYDTTGFYNTRKDRQTDRWTDRQRDDTTQAQPTFQLGTHIFPA